MTATSNAPDANNETAAAGARIDGFTQAMTATSNTPNVNNEMADASAAFDGDRTADTTMVEFDSDFLANLSLHTSLLNHIFDDSLMAQAVTEMNQANVSTVIFALVYYRINLITNNVSEQIHTHTMNFVPFSNLFILPSRLIPFNTRLYLYIC